MTSPDGINWTIRTSAADNNWISVTYGNGLFVAVSISGTGNRVMTSPDGITWTIRTSAADNQWSSVTYGNGLFVAVAVSGTGNRVMTSPDGITWTIGTSAADNQWYSVTYANGLFVAVAVSGAGNRVMTSPDGITWTTVTHLADLSWRSVAYGNGLFVAVASTGSGNQVMTSPDGITWTPRSSAADNQWYSVTYGNGLFVAVAISGTGNRVMTSPDGINWTIRTSAADNQWISVTYGSGLFVAVAVSGTGNRVMTSPDGITWTIRTSAADNNWNSVTYGNGLFVAVAISGSGNRVMTSPDGITWTIRTSAADNNWNSVTYGNGLFVAVSFTGSGNRVMTSPDGITWTIRTSAADNQWLSVTYGNGLFVAVAVSGTGNRVMTSPDGITWTIGTSAANNSWYSVIYGNGLFVAVAVSGTGNRVMTSGTHPNVWTGEASNEWNNAANWTSGIPASDDNVTITDDASDYPELEVQATVGNLTVALDASFSILADQSLTVEDDLINNGTFTIEADATGMGSLITEGTISGSGDFQMEQYLLGKDDAPADGNPDGVFQYISSAVVGATAATYNPDGDNKLWSANEVTQTYTLESNATALNLGEGYVARMVANGVVTFSGTAFNTETVNINGLTRTGLTETNRGYNLIGNPYPSAVNWDAASKTNMETTMWYRTHDAGGAMTVDTYNSTGSIGTNNNYTGNDATGIIPPGQGFRVRVDADGNTGSVSFTNAMRSHGTLASIYRQAAEEGTVRINLSNGTTSDEAIIAFNTEAADSYDDFDSQKLWASNIPQLYTTIGADSLTINGLYSTTTNPVVDLGIKAPTAGNYTINATSITVVGETVHLEDRMLNIFQDLNVEPNYSFTSVAGNIGNRFALHFGMIAVGIDAAAAINSRVYSANGQLNIILSENTETGNVEVLDMAGRIVRTINLNANQTSVELNVNAGVYLVRVETAKGTNTHKIILN